MVSTNISSRCEYVSVQNNRLLQVCGINNVVPNTACIWCLRHSSSCLFIFVVYSLDTDIHFNIYSLIGVF